jgi:hypothetical protein
MFIPEKSNELILAYLCYETQNLEFVYSKFHFICKLFAASNYIFSIFKNID